MLVCNAVAKNRHSRSQREARIITDCYTTIAGQPGPVCSVHLDGLQTGHGAPRRFGRGLL